MAEQQISSLMMKKRSSGLTQSTTISVHAPRVAATLIALGMLKGMGDETSQKIPVPQTLTDLKGIKERMEAKGAWHDPLGALRVDLGMMTMMRGTKGMMTIPENVSGSNRK